MKQIVLKVLLLAGMLVFGVPASADLDDAFSAYESGDKSTAFREFRKLAKQGHAGAQYNLGWMYANGEGVSKSSTKAVKWYRKAAEQGEADAQFNLGVMYVNREGIIQNLVEAYKWFALSEAQGIEEASEILKTLSIYMEVTKVAKAKRRVYEWQKAQRKKASQ